MAEPVNTPPHKVMLPSLDSLDEQTIETFYDADLNEMSIHFYGRDRPHDVDPVNDVLSTLNDLETGEIVGVVFSRFLKLVIQELPESRIFFDDAAILTGPRVLYPPTAVPAKRSFANRLVSSLRAMRKAWQDGSDASADDQRRRVFESIPSLCSQVGVRAAPLVIPPAARRPNAGTAVE